MLPQEISRRVAYRAKRRVARRVKKDALHSTNSPCLASLYVRAIRCRLNSLSHVAINVPSSTQQLRLQAS